MTERDRVVLDKMLHYCIEVQLTHQYFGDDESIFANQSNPNSVVYKNAVTMPILQIGELAKQLSKDFIYEHSEIPWKSIMGMRDIFAHHYGSVRLADIWETSHTDIDKLRVFLTSALK